MKIIIWRKLQASPRYTTLSRRMKNQQSNSTALWWESQWNPLLRRRLDKISRCLASTTSDSSMHTSRQTARSGLICRAKTAWSPTVKEKSASRLTADLGARQDCPFTEISLAGKRSFSTINLCFRMTWLAREVQRVVETQESVPRLETCWAKVLWKQGVFLVEWHQVYKALWITHTISHQHRDNHNNSSLRGRGAHLQQEFNRKCSSSNSNSSITIWLYYNVVIL